MKFSSIFVSSIACLNMVAAKKHGLRRALTTKETVQCSTYFSEMDLDGDNVLSLNDIKNVMVYLIDEANIDETEVRTFAHDLSAADTNNDGQIDKLEFMNACTAEDRGVSSTMRLHSEKKAKKIAAEKKAEQAIKKAEQEKKKAKQALLEAIHYTEERIEGNDELMEAAAEVVAEVVERDEQKKKADEKLKKVEKAKKALLMAVLNHNVQDTGITCAQVFGALDIDQDGTLFYSEAESALRGLGATEEQIEEFLAGGQPGESRTLAEFCMPEEEAKKKTKNDLLAAAEEVVEEVVEQEEAEEQKIDIHTYSEVDVNECKGFFKMMDLDEDGELSVDDLEGVIDSKVKAHVDKAEIRQFVEDIGKADLDNDEIISMKEFMYACLND